MGAFWKLEESRLVQQRGVSSAVNADLVDAATVPAGKIWVVTGAGYMPDAAETQIISFYKMGASGSAFCIFNPLSIALNPAMATFIEQGMEYTLFPGEYLRVRRAAHTAGSTMGFSFQFIEIDQPLYTYEEPQIIKRQARALSSIRTALGGGGGRGSSPPVGGRGGRGGGSSGIPI